MLQLSQLSVRCLACKPLQTHQQTHVTSLQPRISCRQRQIRCINRVTFRMAANTHQAQPLQASSVETISSEAMTAEEAASAERPAGTALAEETSTSSSVDVPFDEKLGISVRVQNLYKDYHVKKTGTIFKAAQDINLEFPANKIIALLGPSGSGKTTLLRLIAGLEQVTSGRIFFGDQDATHLPVQDRQIGMVFQSYALFRHMTVAENITFGPRIQDMDIDEDERVAALLKMVEMPGYENHKPPQLSGGQRQRIALARALACEPQLLLLDEPFGALDPQVRKTLRDSVKDIIHQVGVTSILVTHDQEEAFDIADKVVIFNRGRIEQQGTPREILDAPATPFVMNFIADVNQLPSTCQFVKRMGIVTDKSHVMVQPTILVMKKTPEGKSTVPATIQDKLNVGWLVKYFLIFDDNQTIEVHVRREDDSKYYSDLDIKQRVHLHVDVSEMMPYNLNEISSSPLG